MVGSSAQNVIEDVEKQPLVRHGKKKVLWIKFVPKNDTLFSDHIYVALVKFSLNIIIFCLDLLLKWGGISSLEHDEAVMLEAALFGGVREASAYHVPHAPHQFMQNDLDGTMGPHPRGMRHPPSPSLTAQRKIREQQVCILN